MEFEVVGKPVAKARPRVCKFGAYTPIKTINYETLINYTFNKKFPNFKPYEGGLRLKVIAIFEPQKSISKKRRLELLPKIDGQPLSAKGKITKPDLDNIIKSITDALNGVAYRDDSQITDLVAHKVYGNTAKVIIEIEEI